MYKDVHRAICCGGGGGHGSGVWITCNALTVCSQATTAFGSHATMPEGNRIITDGLSANGAQTVPCTRGDSYEIQWKIYTAPAVVGC